MCDPIGIGVASLALGAASSATQYIGQQRQADATAQAAQRNYQIQQQQEALARQEQREAFSQEAEQNTVEAAQARGSLKAAAGSAGVTGNSLAALLNDINRQELVIDSNIGRSQFFAERQSVRRQNAYRAQAQSRINSVPLPSHLATGLQIGGHGLDAATTTLQLKAL